MLNPKNAINRLIKQYALDIRVPENATTRDTRGHQKIRPDAALKAGRNEEPSGEEKKRNLTTKCGKMAKGEDRAMCSGGGIVERISTKFIIVSLKVKDEYDEGRCMHFS